jgi:transposase
MPNPRRATNSKPPVPHPDEVVGGVDTHADTHTAAALDPLGQLLGTATFPASAAGYRQLLAWLGRFGPVARVGVEGTGSYGVGLTRYLTLKQVPVVEVNRPARADRRRRGKSDTFDAENAARAALAGTATAVPKTRDGKVEAIRLVHSTRAGAVKARSAAWASFHNMVLTSPDTVRDRLIGLTRKRRLDAALHFPAGSEVADPQQAAQRCLTRLAQRIQTLSSEIADADTELKALTAAAAPQLLTQPGVGPETTAQLLITVGDNPHRIDNEAAFAALCGTSPVPASSGRTQRHRLNRGGDRQANRALHIIAVTRLRRHQPTRDYIATRNPDGKATPHLMRCLKRHLARDIYQLLTNPVSPPIPPPLPTAPSTSAPLSAEEPAA